MRICQRAGVKNEGCRETCADTTTQRADARKVGTVDPHPGLDLEGDDSSVVAFQH
jgi:hypothetical protein